MQAMRLSSTRSISQIQNRELLVGDVLVLVSFCIYKQARACRTPCRPAQTLLAGNLPDVTPCHPAMLLSTECAVSLTQLSFVGVAVHLHHLILQLFMLARCDPVHSSIAVPGLLPAVTNHREIIFTSRLRCSQITAIILLPSFPGMLAPLAFNPLRFEEFASFAATVCGTWVAVGLLTGAYRTNSTSGRTPYHSDWLQGHAEPSHEHEGTILHHG